MFSSINYSKEDGTCSTCVKLSIQDVQTRKTLFEVQTNASDVMRWSVQWLSEKSIQLKSSDIGTYCWGEGNNGIWEEAECPP